MPVHLQHYASGNHGIMLGGSTARNHEITLYVYLGLVGKDLFVQNFFGRCFLLNVPYPAATLLP